MNKSSLKSGSYSALGPSSFPPVQRKVAWQSVDATLDQERVDSLNESDHEVLDEDSFQPPILAAGDSASEYDTDIETEQAPGSWRKHTYTSEKVLLDGFSSEVIYF